MSIIKLLTSSVGRKILMAITGLLLAFFMAFHLFGNLFLFVGEEAFNAFHHIAKKTLQAQQDPQLSPEVLFLFFLQRTGQHFGISLILTFRE